MTDNSQFASIIQDANDNYDNGRLDDAYHHFSILTEKSKENSQVCDTLYFGYRSLVCLDQLDRQKDFIRDMIKIGSNLVKQALVLSNEYITESSNPKTQVNLLRMFHQTIIDLDLTTYLEPIQSAITDRYIQLSEEVDLTNQERIDCLEKLIHFVDKYHADFDASRYEKSLAELLIEQGNALQKDEIEIYQKLKSYEDALELLDDSTELYEEIATKIEELKIIRDSI